MTVLRRLAGSIVSGTLLVVALLVAALFLVPKALGHDVYVITTGSMAGTIDPGALVIAERVPVAQLSVGDVITFVPPPGSGVDHLVTHRITAIGADAAGATSYTTKGDANPGIDPWTFTLDGGEQARMLLDVPHLGRPVLWLADRETRMLVVGLPAAAVALLALVDVVRGLRRTDDEQPLAAPTVPAVPA